MLKKILYIGGFDLPDKNAAAHRVIGNSKILNELGYEVILVGLSDKKSSEWFYYEGFKCYNLKYPNTFNEWITYLFTIKEYTKIAPNLKHFKYLFLYNFPSIPLVKFILLKKKDNFKIISDLTEWPEIKIHNIRSILKKIDVFFRVRVLIHKSDALIVISDFLFEYFNMHSNKINVPPLVDCNSDKWNTNISEDKNNIRYIVYAGSPEVSPGQGGKDKLRVLVETYITLNNIKNLNYNLVIVGIDLLEYKQHFGICSEFENSLRNITFLGRINHSNTINIVKDADFSIIVRDINRTNSSGFPTKFVESISAGTPVICSDTSNLEHYLSKNKNFGIIIKRDNDLKSVLAEVNEMNTLCINNKKSFCKKSRIFDYRNYIASFKILLK